MPKITINKAVELTGKSKRTIQRHISSGKITFTERKDGTRMLDEGEVILSFGQVPPLVTPTVSQDVTPLHNVRELMALMQQAISQANQPLIDSNHALARELAEVKAELKSFKETLEHKPDLVVQEVKASEEALAEKAVEAAVVVDTPAAPVTAPLTSSYLDDIPSFLGKR